MKKLFTQWVLAATLLVGANMPAMAQSEQETTPDEKFYIYLCFGQSNMEGNAQPESVDRSNIDSRFRMLATCNFTSPSRTLGHWYAATPPIVSPWGGLGMADWFGRTMVAALPADYKVGVVDVAIGGIAIEGFMPDKIGNILANAEQWQKERIIAYGSNPYQRLVDMGKVAQQSGVIKGILLHQGCSNNNDPNWPNNVKSIYNNLLNDLNLNAEDVPLFVGETLRQENGGGCYAHNTQVNRMPTVVPTSHVISSYGCPGNGRDAWHFNATGYRIMGKRYAYAALEVMGREPKMDPDYNMAATPKKFYVPRQLNTQGDLTLKCGSRKKLTLQAVFQDGHKEDVASEAVYTPIDCDFTISNGMLSAPTEGKGSVEVSFTDFTGQTTTSTFNVEAKFFPFDKANIRTNIYSSGTYDEETRTFHTGRDGQMGWSYESNVDMSGYKYLVVKLKEPQTCAAHLNIFPQASIWGNCYSSEDFGDKTVIIIPLEGAILTSGANAGDPLDTKKIRIVSFFTDGSSDLVVEDVFLTNSTDIIPTGIHQTSSTLDQTPSWYSVDGVKLSGEPAKKGVYINNGRKVVNK